MNNKDIIYIVSGDEMKKMMDKLYPDYVSIPFREDFSKGLVDSYSFTDDFIKARASLFGVSNDCYYHNLKSIINIDLSKDYILVFGEDDCCKSNLNFLINYFKGKNYHKPLKVKIVNEYSLQLLNEYDVVL